jgi:hypothetical protein
VLQTLAKPLSPAAAEIERLGLPYHEEPNYDLELLSKDRRVQVRESDNYAPPESVAAFATQMAEKIFPPIVATADNWLVDGATREGAFAVRKQRYASAIIIGVAFDTPTTTAKQKNTLFALGVTLNQANGVRLTLKETLARVPCFLALGWKIEKISVATGLGENHIKRLKKEQEIRTRLERVGLGPEAGSMSTAKILSFAGKHTEGLNNEPFK